MGKLDKKVAIITGATSGIGKAIAVKFAEEGARVIITGRNKARAKEVVASIKNSGHEAAYVIADMNNLESPGKIFDFAMQSYGTIDILVNNAGKMCTKRILSITPQEWEEMMNVNVTSAMLLTQLVAPVMKEHGNGHILNTSSTAGFSSAWGPVSYCTTKHAMVGLTKSMARELGPEIHVNGICPGAVDTPMLDIGGGEAACGSLKERSPLKRIGQVNDIAAVALFLVSKDASYIDGQLIRIDGGIDC